MSAEVSIFEKVMPSPRSFTGYVYIDTVSVSNRDTEHGYYVDTRIWACNANGEIPEVNYTDQEDPMLDCIGHDHDSDPFAIHEQAVSDWSTLPSYL